MQWLKYIVLVEHSLKHSRYVLICISGLHSMANLQSILFSAQDRKCGKIRNAS